MAKNDNKLDQFYTKPKEAQRLYDLVFEHYEKENFDIFLEPSCGKNSFGCLFPKTKELLLDIDPPEKMFSHKEKKYKQKFVKMDFLAMGELEKREGCRDKQPTAPKGASFAMKAYGANCGEIVTENLHELRPKSWHWVKCDDPEWLIKRFNKLDYSISKDTVRQDSIGRAELVKLYSDFFDKST